MRQLLLDAHVALWALSSPSGLSPKARALIEDPHNTVAVWAVSVWEVAIKQAAGKLSAPTGFAAECREAGFDPLAITFEHATAAGALPMHHADPSDRMLIAQAIDERLELVSEDRVFAEYEGIRLVAQT
ncbi:type II toxin-antitoxin system VapC family toxin [soil metagenome]